MAERMPWLLKRWALLHGALLFSFEPARARDVRQVGKPASPVELAAKRLKEHKCEDECPGSDVPGKCLWCEALEKTIKESGGPPVLGPQGKGPEATPCDPDDAKSCSSDGSSVCCRVQDIFKDSAKAQCKHQSATYYTSYTYQCVPPVDEPVMPNAHKPCMMEGRCAAAGDCDWCGIGYACCKLMTEGDENANECMEVPYGEFWTYDYECVRAYPAKVVHGGDEYEAAKKDTPDCYDECGGSGRCPKFCGPTNACCKLGDPHSPSVCQTVQTPSYTQDEYYECVNVEPEGESRIGIDCAHECHNQEPGNDVCDFCKEVHDDEQAYACCRLSGNKAAGSGCLGRPAAEIPHNFASCAPFTAMEVSTNDPENCWNYCSQKSGYCSWCGDGMACCRPGDPFAASECEGTVLGSYYFTCSGDPDQDSSECFEDSPYGLLFLGKERTSMRHMCVKAQEPTEDAYRGGDRGGQVEWPQNDGIDATGIPTTSPGQTVDLSLGGALALRVQRAGVNASGLTLLAGFVLAGFAAVTVWRMRCDAMTAGRHDEESQPAE